MIQVMVKGRKGQQRRGRLSFLYGLTSGLELTKSMGGANKVAQIIWYEGDDEQRLRDKIDGARQAGKKWLEITTSGLPDQPTI